MQLTNQKVLRGLEELEEEQLTNEVIYPLLEVLHPGRIEYTHSPMEAGRDLVSFGQDYLNRPHILCVQVKALKLSYGAPAFTSVINAAEGALRIQVTLENGELAYPSEVWVVTSHPFPEQKRRQLLGFLSELSRKGIKVIAGEELSTLLTKNLPKVATWLSKYSSSEIMNLLSELSAHKEGRAFGFSTDKNIEEFYITTTLAPYIAYTNSVISNKFKVANFLRTMSVPVRKLIKPVEFGKNDKELTKIITNRIIKEESGFYFSGYRVKGNVKFEESIKKIKEKYVSTFFFSKESFSKPDELILNLKTRKKSVIKYIFSKLSPDLQLVIEQFSKEKSISIIDIEKLAEQLNILLIDKQVLTQFALKESKIAQDIKEIFNDVSDREMTILANRSYLDEIFIQEIGIKHETSSSSINIEILFDLEATIKQLIEDAKKVIKNCPKELKNDVSGIQHTVKFLSQTEKFLKSIPPAYKEIISTSINKSEINESLLRIQITSPENLIKLDQLVLIEGFPGCGKTTLLRILAIKLLNLNNKILYLPCFKISPSYQDKSFKEIITNFALGASQIQENTEGFILIIDGLDESPFNLSDRILKNTSKFSNIIVSTRIAFSTSIRSEFLHISVAPFNPEERNEFFRRWLGGKSDLMKTAKELIEKYKDVDIHTRIPLIATITVALIQRGFHPTTRAEIYSNRLDLLLSNWDKLRGVKRLKIDYPDAKRRFLRELAYRIHSDNIRRRDIDDKSIMRGRQISSEDFLTVYESSLGNWGYGIDYREIFDDLVLGSGILIEERPNVYSFGHLTFQEHLVGEYISEALVVRDICNLLGADWWREPLNFYASTSGDITKLIEFAMRGASFLANIEQLNEMVKFAPYTSPGAIDCIKDSLKSAVIRGI